MSSNRYLEWKFFSTIVGEHIEDYTIPQYGDSPSDEVEQWTPEMCNKAIQKYTKRFESGQRGKEETLRDMLKVAHFACITYFKIREKLLEEGLIDIKRENPYNLFGNDLVHGSAIGMTLTSVYTCRNCNWKAKPGEIINVDSPKTIRKWQCPNCKKWNDRRET